MCDRRKGQIRNTKYAISRGEGFTIIIDKQKVSGHYINTIHDRLQGIKLMKYWNKQGQFPIEENNHVD